MARDIAAVILGALALTASFPKLDAHLLVWVAVVPLLLAAAGRSAWRGWWLGVLFGFVHQVTALYWLSHAMTHFGGLSLPLAALATVALAGYLAVFWGLFGVLAARTELRHPGGLLLLGAAWAGLAWVQGWLFSGFPWTLLGYAAARSDSVGQLAALGGVYAPGFLAVSVNAAVGAALLHRRAALRAALVPLAGVAAAVGFGAWQLAAAPSLLTAPPGDETLRIGLVQGNVPQDRKWSPEDRQQVLADHLRLTQGAIDAGASLVFWPESSWPDPYGLERDLAAQQMLGGVARNAGAALVVGTVHVGEEDGGLWVANAAVLVDGEGSLAGRYDKTHLVPFGEYLPLRRWLGALGPLVQAVGEMRPGDPLQALLAASNPVVPPLGLAICYEVIFPTIAARQVRQGAELLATITNDAWYGDTAGPYQHFAMARLRAIENRRWLVRAANNGISGVFDPWGRVVVASRLNEQAVLTSSVQPRRDLTPYSRYGDVFAAACAIVTLVGLALSSRPTRRGGRR